jgi:hypothetical protein
VEQLFKNHFKLFRPIDPTSKTLPQGKVEGFGNLKMNFIFSQENQRKVIGEDYITDTNYLGKETDIKY